MVPSSLCAPSNSCFLDLHHETSDELVERLVSLDSALSWHLRLLDTEEDAESDLLSLTVTGWSGAEATLSTTPAKVSVPDAVLAWQRMPRQPPVSTRHGRGDGATSNASPTDERRSRADAAIVAMGDRGALPSAECDDDADEDEYAALVEASGAFDGALGDGAVDDILEDLEKELMGNESQAPEQPDEDIFGDRGPNYEDLCASLRQAHADTLQAELASVGVEGHDNSGRATSLSEHIAPSSPPRASSSTDAMPIAPVAPPAGDASATPALSSEAPVVIEAPLRRMIWWCPTKGMWRTGVAGPWAASPTSAGTSVASVPCTRSARTLRPSRGQHRRACSRGWLGGAGCHGMRLRAKRPQPCARTKLTRSARRK